MPKAKAIPPPTVPFKKPSIFGGSKFSIKQSYKTPKFNPTQFHTQHKGGS